MNRKIVSISFLGPWTCVKGLAQSPVVEGKVEIGGHSQSTHCSFFENISEFTALRDRLLKDIRFRNQCGFELARRIHSISTFSRVFGQITKKGIALKAIRRLGEAVSERKS